MNKPLLLNLKSSLFLIAMIFVLTSFKNNEKPAIKQQICTEINGINLDFTLINNTGYDISDVYVSPTNEKEWGEDIMGKDILAHGDAVDISFDGDETVKKWDMYVTWVGYESDEDVYWLGFDLSKISEISLYYDHKTGKTWAEIK